MEIEGNLVDLHNDTIYPCKITVENGIIKRIVKTNKEYNIFIVPGYVDSHIHIESSLLCPSRFAEVVIPHGTVATVSDPHEIVNVLGIEGIKYMIEDSKQVPLKIFYTAPSCVPATIYETNGAIISYKEIEQMFSYENVIALGEVMDYEAVINEDEEILKKIEVAKKYKKVIDGHAPLLRGEKLKKYISFGISTDHESVYYEEGLEKVKLGIKLMIREGSVAKNMKELINLLKEGYECFIVTDDILVSDLLKGHLDFLLNLAVTEYNIDPLKALKSVSLYPISHYKIPVGLLKEGDYADFNLIKNLKDFTPLEVYINGKLVAKDGNILFKFTPKITGNTVKASKLTPENIKIFSKKDKVKVNVIGIVENQIITKHLIEELDVINYEVKPNINKDILKIVVVERYGYGNISVGFIKGFGFKDCAIASSIAHDSHNIISVGTNDELIANAVNLIISNGGGLSFVSKEIQECLDLPIAGLMSYSEPLKVSEKLERLNYYLKLHGCKLNNPYITLSFMSLLVIPELKISDKGLFDVKNFKFIPLIID